MTRLPLALIWLLSVMAGALPATRPPAGWQSHASILAAEPISVPSVFKPVRLERLQVSAPTRPSPWRHTAPQADVAAGRGNAYPLPVGRIERSPRRLTFLVPAARVGTPRFPTGPPAA